MHIDIVLEADEELYRAFQRLVPQLTNNNPPPSLDDLASLVRGPSSTLLVARGDHGAIVGALTLAVYRVPTGIRSIIEDVIVDQDERGQGIGEALLKRGIELARQGGAANISLTSNPARETANRLYLRMGFKKRETNSYQLKL
jgi:ribosomal protein S18 acetylase RimI-like enzyme